MRKTSFKEENCVAYPNGLQFKPFHINFFLKPKVTFMLSITFNFCIPHLEIQKPLGSSDTTDGKMDKNNVDFNFYRECFQFCLAALIFTPC